MRCTRDDLNELDFPTDSQNIIHMHLTLCRVSLKWSSHRLLYHAWGTRTVLGQMLLPLPLLWSAVTSKQPLLTGDDTIQG